MQLDRDIENKIEAVAFAYAEKSRPGWQVPHLRAAVFYMKELIAEEGGDPRILLPAIYLHDIGYVGILTEGYSYDENLEVKKDHMAIGAEISKKVLHDMGSFSEEEVDKISRLVNIHDNLEAIAGSDAQLVFEADSLAQIDTEKVKPTFDKENYRKFIADFEKKRVPLFKTKTGHEFLDILLPKAEKYFNGNSY